MFGHWFSFTCSVGKWWSIYGAFCWFWWDLMGFSHWEHITMEMAIEIVDVPIINGVCSIVLWHDQRVMVINGDGNDEHNYGKSPSLLRKLTISMAIFKRGKSWRCFEQYTITAWVGCIFRQFSIVFQWFSVSENSETTYPICSMYGIFIYLQTWDFYWGKRS